MIEINAQPHRLDLDWLHAKRAKEMGIPIVINPDAHSTGELELFRFGVDVARRGWLTKDDVFNTRGLKEVVKELKRRKGVGRSQRLKSLATPGRPPGEKLPDANSSPGAVS